MLVNLSGRLAVVSGAASGIGRATAFALARTGCNVAVLDRDGHGLHETMVAINTQIEAAGKGGRAKAFAVDVSDEIELTDAIEEAVASLEGRLSCAVNAAGVTSDAFMHNMSTKQWDRVMNINLKGAFLVTKTVAAAIKAGPQSELGGSIVNISSIIGKTGNLGQGNYAASKAGVVAFSKSVAKELARDKIRVNSVLPGFIDTPMAQAVPEKVLHMMLQQIPLGRLGQADEIANLCVFLCSDYSSFITGASIEATGGQFM